MYEQRIDSATPGCIVFLLDRSHSMSNPWPSGGTLAQGAATALNRTLDNLVTSADRSGRKVRHYFDVGVFGYGQLSRGGQGVENALGGALAGRGLVSLPDLDANVLRVEKAPSPDHDGPPVLSRVWVDPASGEATPMCEAMAVAGAHVYAWAEEHQKSHPPIIINITDGQVTDSPHQDAGLEEWATRLRSIKTRDGTALLFNVFLSRRGADPVRFPATAGTIPSPGPELFEISSVLPEKFVNTARAKGVTVPQGGRGFCFNADFHTLQLFLDIGTPTERPDGS